MCFDCAQQFLIMIKSPLVTSNCRKILYRILKLYRILYRIIEIYRILIYIGFPVGFIKSWVVHGQQKNQFSSITQLCTTLYNPMDCSTSGFPVPHQLPEFAQIRLHQIGDAIQSSHPLSSPSPPDFNLSQHQGLFQWVRYLRQGAKVLEFQLQYQSFQWIFFSTQLSL